MFYSETVGNWLLISGGVDLLRYCRFGVKHRPINQSINQPQCTSSALSVLIIHVCYWKPNESNRHKLMLVNTLSICSLRRPEKTKYVSCWTSFQSEARKRTGRSLTFWRKPFSTTFPVFWGMVNLKVNSRQQSKQNKPQAIKRGN